MISAFSLSSLGTYTFPSLYMIPSTSHYSLSLSIFTPACFISSTSFTTLLSFTLNCLTFSSRSTPSVLYTSSHSSLTNVSSLLSLSTPISQSGLLLRLSAFSILLSRTCLSIKSNLDRYRAHLACLLFNFCIFMKYSRFLWSVQILNFVVVLSREYLHISKYLTTANCCCLSLYCYFISFLISIFIGLTTRVKSLINLL